MPLNEIMKDLVDSVPGATGAILADWEGEAVVQFTHLDEFEMKVIGAHKGIILDRAREMNSIQQMGKLEHIVITAGKLCNVVAAIGPEYYLVLTYARSTPQGIALRKVEAAVALLEKEIC